MSEYMLPYQPSLASATNTRVDSACKHHHQCRVSTDDMLQMTIPRNNATELTNNKYRYCVHKDELVLSVSRPWLSAEARKKMNNAYPRVISNLGMIDGSDEATQAYRKLIVYMYHNCRNLSDKEQFIEAFLNDGFVGNTAGTEFFTAADRLQIPKWMPMMHDYMPMGFSQTLGYAHPTSGDTMTTVMIGGLRTVLNGDFEVFTGDVLQWYWPFERDCFKIGGQRKPHAVEIVRGNAMNNVQHHVTYNVKPTLLLGGVDDKLVLEKDGASREVYHNQIYGQQKNHDKVVAKIKPYWKDEDTPRMYDQVRVFAIAISCARPHEMVDIKISRQSL